MEKINDLIDCLVEACYFENEESARKGIEKLIELFLDKQIINNDLLLVFNQINSALEEGDYVAIADYCEFGLKPILNNQPVSNTVFFPYSEIVPNIESPLFYLAALNDDEPVLCINKKEKIIRLNSVFSPYNEAEYIIKHLKIKKYIPFVCLFGIGTGILAEKLLSSLSEDSRLLIYEPDNSIVDFCEKSGENLNSSIEEKRVSRRIKSIIDDSRVVLYVVNNSKISFQRLLEATIDYTSLIGLVHIVHNGYRSVYYNECLHFYREINSFREIFLTNGNTEMYFKDAYVRYSFSNIHLCKKINLVCELSKIVPKDIPAIIVSAGPSLNKNIDVLRKAKGHFFIVAVDTAVQSLLKRNILPDITITVDPEKPSSYYDHPLAKTIPCIFASNANTKLLDKLEGRYFLIDGRGEYLELLLNYMNIETGTLNGYGGSVATAAFAVLVGLGLKNIILIGQDLAYVGETTHVDGVNDGFEGKKIYVEDVFGNQIATRRDWLSFLKWFEVSIEDITKAEIDTSVIDATEGGAKIHGTKVMTLNEAIDSFKDKDGKLPEFIFEKELDKLPCLFDENGYKKLCENHKVMINRIRDIENYSYEAAKLCEDLIVKIRDKNASDQYIHKQNKLIKELRLKIEKIPIYFIIHRYARNFTRQESARLELEDGEKKDMQINLVVILKLHFDSCVQASKLIYDIAKEYENDL